MTFATLFLFGLVFGSFLNVVILRYDGEKFLLDLKVLGGRSHCPHCGKTLQWYELVPVVSYLVQRGRCRNCHAPLSAQYPIVELISGGIFLLVPLRLAYLFGGPWLLPLSVAWVVALEALLVASCIDIRMGIIPDELNVAVAVAGLFNIIYAGSIPGEAVRSFFGPYAVLFGLQGNFWTNHLAAALLGGGFFLLLVFGTPYIFKKEGMGMGDAKLAAALGFLFGWPDILLLSVLGFMLGALAGIAAIAVKKKTMRATIPFGPFLAIGAATALFGGFEIVSWYFRLAGFGA